VSDLPQPARNDASRTTLGRTGLDVCRIGIGCGNGLSSSDLEYAVALGVNYVFTSTDFHAPMYSRSWPAVRRFCRRGSRRRHEVVLVACSYVNDPEKVAGVVADHLVAWNLDHVDIFQWGWVTRANDPRTLVSIAERDLCTAEGRAMLDRRFSVVRHVRDELQCRGYARHIAVSTHDRRLASELAAYDGLDVVMLRYNTAHRGAEDDVFPVLAASPNRVGTVVFNVGHTARGSLTVAPAGLPAGKHVPDQAELYRFALDRSEIDVVLTGPSNRAEVDAAMSALQRPPLSPEKRRYLEKLGDVHRGIAELQRPT
jgi:aryl-alcohol dehydrogenase-like predicted oxidoreductase